MVNCFMHIPVLLNEVVENLNLSDSKKVLDCTLGGGGHTLEILRQYPEIAILGIEWDPMLARDFKEKHGDKITIVNDSYVNLKNICREHNFQPDAILFDLGLSSWHYEESGRGFSFRKDEMLDMRFNPERGGLTAAQIINTYDSRELERILREYGEEDFARNISLAVVNARKEKPVISVSELVGIVETAVPEWYKHKKIHFATKTFQSLRIAVNGELENVKKGANDAIEVLKSGGRIAAISFHGLEDKILKELFRAKAKENIIRLINKNVVKPQWQEIMANPRSRSAKLRVAEKI
ncbi:MAG: 16S rRNA (cytosine(1402)-N(4))-methyltransferase [Candidatus Yanofskybacteria bacterium RIFCSPHIGHO2_01_FULL_45_42]|uniref:Ribosomal RNA small subunit methyltransferase H n=3 Tax=Candidatus Yanofskyibacteriota TaxID=1752733 RepID=A0A1F8H3G5_9BACT|nr:MAG: 16S rRNA (cytosine(1402)-N(4))-methyltransferase [Candidatus Yanofskybacteria bacterium RIFCSPHIGHO2_01_FULL_45_42]OGN16036.1 MAG: 16S rRNA (cytosine(1402)-N(4))-methyltransferase [Candidatus Yanofskybacteria bacterium RIFCSPHIGHO2_02_FULL_46_19]OGN26161.1 MAG: 16S rRNA (cytosine(1402)-N(4))-methyltransferase [Candidatus Yanofskybacteria bacterium RIFCSPLOWO2_01_FULL_45_72]OGN32132.1 MAG: 16S rRNA (cytosine(1402)-N(4))-methyltransferase [Candidatus Yanofskybacteria bacterium RIFCSPLOWO2_